MKQKNKEDAFTLIELSIVLVIIGLIVGGVLVGRDLISAAAVRAQIAQIDKYQQAVNTFRGKYNYLPGDIPNPVAAQFGFVTRGQYAGEGDGNGVLEGVANDCACNNGYYEQSGELPVFWVDLSTARLIDGGFTAGSPTVPSELTNDLGVTTTPHKVSQYFPEAKIGQNNFVWVWSPGSVNSYGIVASPAILGYNSGVYSMPGLTVVQAYNMDKKIDDGLPQTGTTLAKHIIFSTTVWAAGGTMATDHVIAHYEAVAGAAPGATTPASSDTCYDNANTAGAAHQYSVTTNGGSGTNCALSIKFQ